MYFPSRDTDIKINGWLFNYFPNRPIVIIVHGLFPNGKCKSEPNLVASLLIKSGINQGITEVEIYREDTGVIKKSLNFEGINILEDEDALHKIGISPWRYSPKAKIGKVSANSPAEKYNLQNGDKVISINNVPVSSWNELVDQIHTLPGQEILITVKRAGQIIKVPVVTEKIFKDDKEIGRLGVAPFINVEEIENMRVTIQYPFFESLELSLIHI